MINSEKNEIGPHNFSFKASKTYCLENGTKVSSKILPYSILKTEEAINLTIRPWQFIAENTSNQFDNGDAEGSFTWNLSQSTIT